MDPIANMIVAIKNAGDVMLDSTSLPYSKIKESIAKVLKEEGYIKDYEVKGEGSKKKLVISIIRDKASAKIKGIKRVSKTSKRVYKGSSDIKAVKGGYGLLVVTTPQGVMTGDSAKKAGVGGEVLFTIW